MSKSKKPKQTSKQKEILALHREDVKLRAYESGALPHEILLSIARGEAMQIMRKVTSTDVKGQEFEEWVEDIYFPSVSERIDAAKSAAPYYTPKLASQTVRNESEGLQRIASVFNDIAGNLPD